MPNMAINSDGTIDPLVISFTGDELLELLIWNHTGSTVTVASDNQNIAAVKNDDSGNSGFVDSHFSIGPDDCVHLITINNTPESAPTDLTLTFKGSHGSVTPGSRHQPSELNVPGVYVAAV